MTLENGAKLVVLYEPRATSTALEVFFHVGLGDEKRLRGVNAVIARTWTGESENRIAALLQRDVARVGGAGTGLHADWVELWGVCGTGREQARALCQSLLTNMVAAPLFSPENVALGKTELVRTTALETDDLLGEVTRFLRARAWSGGPQGGALWNREAVTSLKPEDVTSHYHKYFRPERAVFVIAGAIEPSDAKRMVENSLGAGGWNKHAPAPPVTAIKPDTIPVNLRPQVLPITAPATVLATGYLVPGTAKTRRVDWATLLILDAVLGGGKSSRLFRALRDSENPVGYDVRTQVHAGRDQSLWAFYIVGASKPDSLRERLQAQLISASDGSNPITEAEVDRARAYLLTRHNIERQRLRDRAFGAGWAEVMGLGADFDTDFFARLALVSSSDVNTLARELLSKPSATVYTQPVE
jgi:predicted Zn-dependent peptidase